MRPAAKKLLLVAVALACLVVGLPIAYWSSGSDGVVAAVFASLVCLLAVMAAETSSTLFAGLADVTLRTGLAMLPRMGIPLGFLIVVYSRGGPLVEAGIVFYLLPFYLVVLTAETLLTVSSFPSGPVPRNRQQRGSDG